MMKTSNHTNQTCRRGILFPLAIVAALLSTSVITISANAQNPAPNPPIAPPMNNSAPGVDTNNDGNLQAPLEPPGGNTSSDEDYDSSSEPFGRGCPFQDNDLQLIT